MSTGGLKIILPCHRKNFAAMVFRYLTFGCKARNTIQMRTQFRKSLEARGIKFATFARMVGVDKSTITRWNQGGVPAERVPEIERVTGIPRHELRPDLWPDPNGKDKS
jgi:DNA-binding transcriptional regulator YdaS (Cro superfamily)